MGWFSKDLTDHNNDGQGAASKGEDRVPPNSEPVSFIVGAIFPDIGRDMQAEKDAYNAGYENTSSQKK